MFKSGLAEGQSSLTKAAAVILAQQHGFYATFVFSPSRRTIDADFPAVRVNSVAAVFRKGPVLGDFRVGAGVRDGAAAESHFVQKSSTTSGGGIIPRGTKTTSQSQHRVNVGFFDAKPNL